MSRKAVRHGRREDDNNKLRTVNRNVNEDKMLNNTWSQYVMIRLVILFLHALAPLCTVYTLTILRRAFFAHHLTQPVFTTGLQLYCLAETLFFVFFLWYRGRLQREAIHPPLRSKEDRKKLFDKVRSEIHDPQKFLQGWFRGAKIDEIGRDDLRDFLGWAFWEGRNSAEDEEELNALVGKVEKMMGRSFKPGKGGAKSLRLTLDPIEMQWRSLLWYGILMMVDTVVHMRFLVYGFGYRGTTAGSLRVFPPRPIPAAADVAGKKSSAEQISYWVKPHTSTTRLPVVYIHGIGVGLHPYVEFLHEIDRATNNGHDSNDQVGIISIEVLQISSRLTHSVPTRAEFLAQITKVLDHEHGFDRFVLISHSYGSVFSTHMLTDDTMSKRVAATLLVDPVTMLLHMPDVAYNFTIRKPTSASEWQLWYFASKDPGVAHTLGRHFFWSENILWRDRITHLVEKRMRVTASLARRDLIVDTEAVGAYLMEKKVPDPVVVKEGDGKAKMALSVNGTDVGEDEDWKVRKWKGKGLEVLWWDDLDHAQVFDNKDDRKKLVEVVVDYCKHEQTS